MDTIIGGAIAIISSVVIAIINILSEDRKRKADSNLKEKGYLKSEIGKLTELAIARGFSSNPMFIDPYQKANQAILKENFELARTQILEISQVLSDISKLHITLEKLAHLIRIIENKGPDESNFADLDGLDRGRYFDRLQDEQDSGIGSFFLWFYSLDGPKLYRFENVQAELSNISNEYQEKGSVTLDTLKHADRVIKSELFSQWKPSQENDDVEYPF